MKLDPNCVRAIILFLEDSEKTCHLMTDICNGIPSYDKKNLCYTINRLYEGGYINVRYNDFNGHHLIARVETLTYEGHLLAETFHDEKIWKKALKCAKEIGTMSIPKLVDIIIELTKGIIPIL